MENPMKKAANFLFVAFLSACVLSGCVSYGPAAEPYQTGNYYDQYSPAYDYYPGQAGYPYSPGYYGYPYHPGYYGYPASFGPSIYLGTSRGSSGIGVGTTFGW